MSERERTLRAQLQALHLEYKGRSSPLIEELATLELTKRPTPVLLKDGQLFQVSPYWPFDADGVPVDLPERRTALPQRAPPSRQKKPG